MLSGKRGGKEFQALAVLLLRTLGQGGSVTVNLILSGTRSQKQTEMGEPWTPFKPMFLQYLFTVFLVEVSKEVIFY